MMINKIEERLNDLIGVRGTYIVELDYTDIKVSESESKEYIIQKYEEKIKELQDEIHDLKDTNINLYDEINKLL